MHSRLYVSMKFISKSSLKVSKRNFTNKSSFIDLTDKTFLSKKMILNEVKLPEISVTEVASNPGLFDFFRGLTESFPDLLYSFKGLFYIGGVEKIGPLINNFYLDRTLIKLNSFNISEVVFCNTFTFRFTPECFTLEGFYFDTIISLLNNRLVKILLLCAVISLMQTVSTILCTDKESYVLTYLCNKINFLEENEINPKRHSIINFYWFINSYNYVISLIFWFDQYLYNNSYKKMYNTILSKVYNNIRHLMVKFYFDLALSKVKLILVKRTLHVLFRFNIVLFAGGNLNIVYAGLTPVYIMLGWLLDYISYLWMVKTNSLKFTQMFNLSFWVKHFFYAILYMVWLSLGVFSTNGVYFLVFTLTNSTTAFNLAIFLIGSIVASISSSFWFIYGNPTILKTFNICRFIIDRVMLPIAQRTSNIYNIRRFLSEDFSSMLSTYYFNHYTSLRRSTLESVSFLGMVFSTYGSWTFYTIHVFYSISIIGNFFIWTVSSFIFGFLLVYIEGTRPLFSSYYYGFVYMLFWTSICFSTNTILLGYINIGNAASALTYFIPINFLLAFIYPIPLYRYSSEVSIIYRLIDLLLFIFLTGVTLLSAGSIWYFIAPLS